MADTTQMEVNGYANPDALVSTAWVAQHRDDPNVRVVEVDVDTRAYEQGHIPGAMGWNWQQELQDQVWRDVVSKENFEKLMSRSGISNDTTVILYGDNHNWFAAYAFWLLKYYGHEDVRLMNGGRAKWLAEDRPLSTEPPEIEQGDYQAKEPNSSVRALRDQVLTGLQQNVTLVDVRSPAEYRGELLAPESLPQEGSQRGGHIPGAKNIVWSNAVREDSTFKSRDELEKLYGGQGITPDKNVIAYCRIGERSAHTWFVLSQLLGYPHVRNYDGSWTEWGSSVRVPIER
ncbi:MAG: sulfurtransferase [Chloroflexota bacterium]|nr:sulfurtransferase [Chloroflexota bacterium]